MRITICDDENFYIDAIAASIDRWKQNNDAPVTLKKFRSSEDLLLEFENCVPDDLFFLDIQFPGEMNGLQLAQEIRKHNEHAIIVFTTNYEEYAIDGYRANALRYLQKPITDVQIFECLDIAYHQWLLLHDTYVMVEAGRVMHKIAYKSIYYIESKAHYIEIHTIRGGEIIGVRCKLGEFLVKLPAEMFVRCHRSFVVNLLYVQSIARNEVMLSPKERLPISARFREELLDRFRKLFG